MGTVNNDMLPFYKNCISAFKETDYQVIMSVGDKVSIKDFGKLPENISVFPQVDQIAVLQKADAFISHAGMNSVSESLYFGVPLVLLPQTAEQKGVAQRVSDLGAGIKAENSDDISVLHYINTILNDNTYKQNAELIATGFKNSTGAKGAADKIIQICNKK